MAKKINGQMAERYVYLDQYRIASRVQLLPKQSTQVYVYTNHQNVPEIIYGWDTPSYRLIADERGSPTVVVASYDGHVAQKVVYDEFGNIVSDSNPGVQPFGFAGCLYDQDTKLCHFGAREYDPEVGRWLTRDPIGFSGGDTNLYNYALSDPVNIVDPSGKFGILLIPFIPEIAAAAVATAEYVGLTAAAVSAGYAVHKFINWMTNSTSLPTTGPAGGSKVKVGPNGEKIQERFYDKEGKAVKDVDYDHDHGAGSPHEHPWEWPNGINGDPKRGPGRTCSK